MSISYTVISNHTGNAYPVDINPAYTIRDLKVRLEPIIKTPVHNQILRSSKYGPELEDYKVIRDCGIDQQQIYLELRAPNQGVAVISHPTPYTSYAVCPPGPPKRMIQSFGYAQPVTPVPVVRMGFSPVPTMVPYGQFGGVDINTTYSLGSPYSSRFYSPY